MQDKNMQLVFLSRVTPQILESWASNYFNIIRRILWLLSLLLIQQISATFNLNIF